MNRAFSHFSTRGRLAITRFPREKRYKHAPGKHSILNSRDERSIVVFVLVGIATCLILAHVRTRCKWFFLCALLLEISGSRTAKVRLPKVSSALTRSISHAVGTSCSKIRVVALTLRKNTELEHGGVRTVP